MNYKNRRHQYEILRSQLEIERNTFTSHWRELGEYVLPRRPRFFTSDANKGDKRNQKIKDNTATLAARTLRSGMMSGVTSPARPWFRLSTPDPALAEIGRVKNWLHIVTQRMSTVFIKSNLYNVLPTIYGDIGVFGTSAMAIEEDFEDVLRFYPFPIGSYMISNNDRLKVDVFFREFRMTVRQLISKFGYKEDGSGEIDWSRFSTSVKNFYDLGQLETWIDICHVIKPNEKFRENLLQSKFKKYSSCYYERGGAGSGGFNGLEISSLNEEQLISEKGYDYFPVLCPRWETTGEDAYGTNCPGMESLPDVKQLQTGEIRTMQAVEKMIKPAMVAPTSMKHSRASILPGDITYVDEREGQKGFRAAHDINFRITEMENKQAQVRLRIQRTYYEDLFLMLANSDRREITAREIDERHEEKLLALGPVLEQLNQDLLDPLIDIAFNIMVARSTDARGNFIEGALIPPPPEELKGIPLKVEYISVMAQAQKLVGISGMERFMNFATTVGATYPQALRKVNFEQALDVYSDMVSVPPGVVRTDEETAEIAAKEEQAMRAQKMAEIVEQGAGAAKDLSQSNLEGDNALTRLLQQGQAGQLAPGQQ